MNTDQIYSNLISYNKVEKKLRDLQKKKLIQKEKLKEQRLLHRYSIPNILKSYDGSILDKEINVENQ